jgi:hypothetical protein
MNDVIKKLLESISIYAEHNVDMMITHRKMLSFLVAINVMILIEVIVIGVVVIKILQEVK